MTPLFVVDLTVPFFFWLGPKLSSVWFRDGLPWATSLTSSGATSLDNEYYLGISG